jgi:hypothetical protein
VRHVDIIAAMDDVLIAFQDGREIPMLKLRSLPPWRAVLLARVMHKAGALSQGAVDSLVRDAIHVGGNGELPNDHWPSPTEDNYAAHCIQIEGLITAYFEGWA